METTINGIDYEKTRVYRAFFESKASADAFAKLVGGSCNVWSWNAWVEK